MQINQLPLNKSTYLNIDNLTCENLLTKFYMDKIWQLPVVNNGKLIGILDANTIINHRKINKSPLDLVKTNIIKANFNDKLNPFLHEDQQILPVVDDNMLYIGYIETNRILDWFKFDQGYQEIEEKYNSKLQNYRDLEEEYNIVLQSSQDVIHIIDNKGVTLRISKSCETVEGVKAEKLIGKNLENMVENKVYSKSVGLEVLRNQKSVTILQKAYNGKEIISTGTPFFKDGKLFRVIINARDISDLVDLKNKIKDTERIKEELKLFRSQQAKINGIVVKSRKMQEVINLATRVSSVDSTVLITGESGVGKGVISNFIHNKSNRKNGPFIKVDVTAIPETLLESELFGYEKGAFTGADPNGKMGLIKLADKGTLFLDEIGDLPLNLQGKLLRLVQDREFIKVGGKKPIKVDIRIITATHKSLEKMVEDKTFRQDLYYRLNVIPIEIPPLRDHKDDIQPLIFNYLEKLNTRYGTRKKLSNDALDSLLEYAWPGNIRELENIIERLIVMSEGDTIQRNDLPKSILQKTSFEYSLYSETSGENSFKSIMDTYEKKLLFYVKEKSKSTSDMAKILMLDRSTIRRKLKKHNIKIDF
ncbi:sigma 54-interacting transcriptional regulator [Virgibacillus dakarensis]|nr:sigma 54-interacting transcriptional regulator [Virgibacillus dakarensis]